MNKIKIKKKMRGTKRCVVNNTANHFRYIATGRSRRGNLYPDDAMETERLVVFLNTTTHRNNASKDF